MNEAVCHGKKLRVKKNVGLRLNEQAIYKENLMASMVNVGTADRVIRIIVGLLLAVWSINAGNLWWILGVALIATGVFRFCGLYRLLGINTCKT